MAGTVEGKTGALKNWGGGPEEGMGGPVIREGGGVGKGYQKSNHKMLP